MAWADETEPGPNTVYQSAIAQFHLLKLVEATLNDLPVSGTIYVKTSMIALEIDAGNPIAIGVYDGIHAVTMAFPLSVGEYWKIIVTAGWETVFESRHKQLYIRDINYPAFQR